LNNISVLLAQLERGASFNLPDISEQLPLHIAATNGYLEVVRLLLERNAAAGGFGRWLLGGRLAAT
jgi:ankyrin repeat protein